MRRSNYATAKYLAPTNTKGARVKINIYNDGWKQPIILPYCYGTGSVRKQAHEYLASIDINPTKLIDHKLTYIFIID